MREWVNSKKALKKVLKAEKCQLIYNVGIWQAHKSFHHVTVVIHKVRWQGLGSPVLSESNWLFGQWIPPLWCGEETQILVTSSLVPEPLLCIKPIYVIYIKEKWRVCPMLVTILWGFLGSGCAYYEFLFCTLGTLSSSIEKPAQDYLNLRNTKAHQSNNLFVISLNCKILKYLQCKFSLSLSHRLQLQWYCASLDIFSYCKIPQH